VSEGGLDRDEMVEILEEIIRDSDTNATARCHRDPNLVGNQAAAVHLRGMGRVG
jgi:hypothetical protein